MLAPKQNRENSVATYMLREIETVEILAKVLWASPQDLATVSDIAIERLLKAAKRLKQAVHYLERGA